MKLAIRIAFRYLFSPKRTNAINIISYVSMIGMAVGAMCLVILLSVFNGFSNLVMSLYNSFNPDLLVTPIEGKVFVPDDEQLLQLSELDVVETYALTLEENAYFTYDEREYIGSIKGVDEYFQQVTAIDSFVVYGEYLLEDTQRTYALIGSGIDLSLNTNIVFPDVLSVYVPKRGKGSYMTPAQAFNIGRILPGGIYSIQQDIDSKYILVPLQFAQDLLRYEEGEVSAIEVKLKPGAKLNKAKQTVLTLMGDGFQIKNKFEQKEVLYRVMKMEKYAIYAILAFMILIISFNIIGSLSMLVIEKEKDIAIMKAMGATDSLIRFTFMLEGALSSILGAAIGMLLGILICLAQQAFGIVKLPGSGFIIDAYPVSMQWVDFAITAALIITISLLASWLPANRAAAQDFSLREA